MEGEWKRWKERTFKLKHANSEWKEEGSEWNNYWACWELLSPIHSSVDLHDALLISFSPARSVRGGSILIIVHCSASFLIRVFSALLVFSNSFKAIPLFGHSYLRFNNPFIEWEEEIRVGINISSPSSTDLYHKQIMSSVTPSYLSIDETYVRLLTNTKIPLLFQFTCNNPLSFPQ